MLSLLFYRPALLPAAIGAVLLLLTLVLTLAISWNSLQRLQPVHEHLNHINRVQQTSMQIQVTLVDSLRGDATIEAAGLTTIRSEVSALLALNGHMAPDTPAQLRLVQQSLSDAAAHPHDTLINALSRIRSVISAEIDVHEGLLALVSRANRLEFLIAAVAAIALPLILSMTLYFFRHHILRPLQNLGSLMNSLEYKRYDLVPLEGSDPMLAELFQNYNRAVSRLGEFEAIHLDRQQTLEQQVRTATRALLEQQRELANTERLAAVGEIAAGFAHELRNPLASITMALSNLRRGLDDPAQTARLDMVLGELRRMTQLLNDVLSRARHKQEALVELDLAECVATLIELVRHQVPESIRLRQRIPSDLCCRLPEGRIRQILLNLILNAVYSIGQGQGEITVSASVAESTLRIEIQDDGPGFPAELLQSGVRSFATLRDTGTGLGLAMVRRFVGELGGDLRLSNRVPNGAEVSLELPFVQSHV